MMVELARYTLCVRSGTKPGKVVASGLTDYETFRSFEMTRYPDDFDSVVASATVPKSAIFENDKAYALELIEKQILRRAGTLWEGRCTRMTNMLGASQQSPPM